MKKHLLFKVLLTFFISLFLSVGWVNGQTTIDFETENSGYTPSGTEGSSQIDVFNRVQPTIGGNSTWIWAVEDISLSNPTIILDAIDITGATAIDFSVDLLTPNSEDWDTTDELLITYSIDGGGSQNLMWIQSNRDLDTDDFNQPAALDLAFDGTGDSGQELPAIADDFSVGVGSNFETFSTNGVTVSGSSLIITLQFNGLTSTAEGIYLDNLTITPIIPNTAPQATWTPANSATLVELDANITIEFDENIYKSDGTTEIVDGDLATLITLKETNASGGDVDFSATYNNTNFTITIDPTSDFDFDSDYYVAFGSVYDDTPLENTGENITFTTKPDTDKDSKVVAPVTQVAAATVESTVTDSVAVFSFTVSDLGTLDGLDTKITQITLIGGPNHTFALDENLADGYVISEGNVSIPIAGDPTITANTISIPFAANTFNIPDGEDSTYTVYFLLDTIQVDGSVIQLMIDADNHGFVADATGSEFTADFTTDVVGNDITINVTATELLFTEQPASTYVGNNLPEVKVAATDIYENIDIDHVTDISITATGATLNATPVVVTPVSGVSTFSTLSFSDEGTDITLTAASGALTNGVSDAFNSFGDDLFFSEYIEGGSYNKALEIYNGTGSDVDLHDYVIRINSGAGSWSSFMDFPVGTNLANGDVYVIAHENANAAILAVTDSVVDDPYNGGTSYVVVFNGDDARALYKVSGSDTIIVDIIGEYDATDPGSGWNVAETGTATANHTIIRKTGRTTGNTDWTSSAGTTEGDSEWIVMLQDYSNNLGAYRDVENDTTLSALTTDNGTLTPTFNATTYDYTVELPFRTITIPEVGATANGTYATVDTVQATSIFASEAERTATATVTADDLGEKIYSVVFSVAIGTENDITSFSFASPAATGSLNTTLHTVTVTVPYGTNVTALVPTIVVSDSATVSPLTGVAKDFTSPVEYTVNAEDGTPQIWTVTVVIEDNTENDILSFIFDSFEPDVVGTPNAGLHTVTATVPNGTNVTALVPTINVSADATVSPVSEAAQDFTSAVDYTVTAQDLTPQIWTVTVNIAAADDKDISSFSFATLGVTGTINEADSTIALTVPFGTEVTALVATYTTTGTEVKVGATTQASGITENNFTSPVVYTVVAADLSERIYTVTVNITSGSNDATVSSSEYTVEDVAGTITNVPYGTTLATFESNITPAANATFETYEDDGTTVATDLATGYKVICTAQDLTAKTYIITIIPASTDATISSLVYTIDNGARTITDVPYGTDLATFEANLTPAAYATFETYQADGMTVATVLETGCRVIVLAQDEGKTNNTYTVTVDDPAGDLFFSEYVEGSSGDDRAFEIYNPTGASVDLSVYSVKQSRSSEGWGIRDGVEMTEYILPLSGTLAAGDVYVVYNSAAATAIADVGDLALTYGTGCDGCRNASFTGNDALGLFKDDVLIDVIGEELAADGAGPWEVAGTADATENHTLLRKSSITEGNTDWTVSAGTNTTDSEWEVKDADYIDDLGSFGPKSGTDILTFSFADQTGAATIDATAHTVDIEVAFGTSPAALVATFTLSSGATAKVGAIDQVSGTTPNDFSSAVTYAVTAEDASTQNWVVTVTVSTTQSSANAVTSFTVEGIVGDATIGDGTITATVEYGTDITSLKPVFVISPLATIADTATARDFTAAETYVVSAEDGTPKNWVVTITVQTATAVTIYDIQHTTETSGDSPYLGELISTSGIVTAIDGSNFWIQDGTGAWNGVMVYSSATVAIGDNIEFIATVDENYNATQLENLVDVNTISSGNDLPAATAITTLQAQDEDYEGVLVKVNASCTNADAGYGAFELNDGSGVILVDDDMYAFTPTLSNVYEITGIGHYSYSERKILPRDANDINEAPSISSVTLTPTTPSSSEDVVISATIVDDHTAAADLTVSLLYGSTEGSETTEVTFTQVGTTSEFTGTIPASSSTVYYKVTASDGSFTSEYTGNYSVTVGINNPDGIVSMNIYPNPSNGKFTLEMNASKAGTFNVEIINIQGQVVFVKQITQDGLYKDQIDISNEARGIYYIRINDGKNVKVSRIIIQ